MRMRTQAGLESRLGLSDLGAQAQMIEVLGG
jgi:hypothetical protein